MPDDGRFRVTVMAARYNDGLLLDPGTPAQTSNGITWKDTKTPGSVTIPAAGVYQVDVYVPEQKLVPPDSSRLGSGLAGAWPADTVAAGHLEGNAKLVDSPVGKAVSLSGGAGSFTVKRDAIPTNDAMNVGEGDFSVAAWIHPSR